MHLQQLSSHFANEPYEAVRARLHSVLVLLPDLGALVLQSSGLLMRLSTCACCSVALCQAYDELVCVQRRV